MAIKELCRNGSFSDATFYKWRAKFGGMQGSEAERLRDMESENAKLKRLLGPRPTRTCTPSRAFWGQSARC